MKFLIVPGIGDSDESHWQTAWEGSMPNCSRVAQENWDYPDCKKWIAQLENAVADSGTNTVVVAHSLGCLLLAHWAFSTKLHIQGALLVAPPDPLSKVFPVEANSFSAFPEQCFKFKSTLVASSNDPYSDLAFSSRCAASWGSEFICIGAFGHINGDSNLGVWPEGQQILARLVTKIDAEYAAQTHCL